MYKPAHEPGKFIGRISYFWFTKFCTLHKFILAFVLTFSGIVAVAQKPIAFSFTHYTTETGLVSNQVNSVLQDEQGYFWIGTADGLQRYDGMRYKTFLHSAADSFSIPVNGVFQLMMDNNHNLWLLQAEGLVGIFNTKTFRYHKVNVISEKKSSINLAISKLHKDDRGNIFFIRNGEELLTWNPVKNELAAAWNFFSPKKEWMISDVVQVPGTEKYYFSIRNLGFALYNKTTGKWSYAGNNTESDPLVEAYKNFSDKNPCGRLFIDRQLRLWFITWPAGFPLIHCYDLKKSEAVLQNKDLISTLKVYHTITGFFQQQDGTVWVTGMMVLAKFNEQEKKFMTVKNGDAGNQGIQYKDIYCLHEDREHNIWVATLTYGLYRFNPEKEYFTNIKHSGRRGAAEAVGNVMSFIQLKDGSFLSGVWGDGLYRYDKEWNEIPVNIKGISNENELNIWSMTWSHDSSTVWMGSQPGLFKYNPATNTATYYDPKNLGKYTVRQVAEDAAGNLWLGMHGTGLYKWDAVKGKKDFNNGIEKIPFIPDNIISKVIVDSRGNIWAGTDNDGAYVIDPRSNQQLLHFGKTEKEAYQLPEMGVSAVFQYSDSIMIVSTSQYLLLYNIYTKQSRVVNLPGQVSGYIAALQKDAAGFLWMATSSCLCRFDIKKNVLVRYDKRDGIEETNFSISAAYPVSDGRLLFGADANALLFDPQKINSKKMMIPNVVITDFKVRNEPLLVDSLRQLKKVELGYLDNSIEIAFSTMSPGDIYTIFYKLDGVDKNWRKADNNALAVYSFLPPGTYTFQVKAANADWSESPVTVMTITINPPFWKTWWFYSLLALAAGGFLFWLDRERMQRKEALQKMRTNIAGNLHHEVNTALNNINILSEMARLKADTDPEKSKEFIEQIHGKSHNMIIAMDDMLWSIDPENDNMEKTVLRMKEFAAALNNRHGSNISMVVDERLNKLNLNMQLRHESLLLFKESILGIVKAGAVDCKIHIWPEKNSLVYLLQYKNDHCDMQQITNLLHSQEMEKRMKAIHAALQIDVQKSFSLLTVKIPLQ